MDFTGRKQRLHLEVLSINGKGEDIGLDRWQWNEEK